MQKQHSQKVAIMEPSFDSSVIPNGLSTALATGGGNGDQQDVIPNGLSTALAISIGPSNGLSVALAGALKNARTHKVAANLMIYAFMVCSSTVVKYTR